MNLKDYDDIKIPDNLNEYIDKGIEKGKKYENSTFNKKTSTFIPAAIASSIILVTASNIPVSANELIKIPIIGELIKVLDFTGSTAFGGVITDGNNIIFDSFEKDSIDIYFTKNGQFVDNVPNYEIEYREYPYTVVLTFNGVRYFENTHIESKLENSPFVKRVYNIMSLDDSSKKFAIEFNDNVSFKISELKNPAMISIKISEKNEEISNKIGIFIVSKEYEYGEELAIAEESLFGYEGVEVQKSYNDKYVIQFGPFDNIEDANNTLSNLKNSENVDFDFNIEERNLGQGPILE